MRDAKGKPGVVTFTIPVVYYQQKVTLRLPFEGTWAVYAGNDLSTGHRRTGLNGLTTYGWDFVKVGENVSFIEPMGKNPMTTTAMVSRCTRPAMGWWWTSETTYRTTLSERPRRGSSSKRTGMFLPATSCP